MISPDHKTLNQIDHVLVTKGKMRLIHDVRSKRGYNCDSDHILIQIKIKQKLTAVKNSKTQKHKWDRKLLNQTEKINKCKERLQSMLQEIKEETDINQDWQNRKEVILEAERQFKSANDVRNTNRWWDDDCKRAIQEKNKAGGKFLIRKTRTNPEIYQQKRIKTNRICRRKNG
jgi:hypothetical protein